MKKTAKMKRKKQNEKKKKKKWQKSWQSEHETLLSKQVSRNRKKGSETKFLVHARAIRTEKESAIFVTYDVDVILRNKRK